MLTYDGHWHTVNCDHCGKQFPAPNGSHLMFKGQMISTEDLSHCPSCKAPANQLAEPEPPQPEELPEWGAF